ncbi:MAG: hypothetical protein M5U25_07140 [Planctomycetota bacterium]|nr:hypothetical protein [Planctomycetota bacterium]
MSNPSAGQIFFWELPRVLSPKEHEEIDARLEEARERGEYDKAIELAENQKSDDRPVVILRREGVNVIIGMCTTQDYSDRGAVRIDPEDVVPLGAMEEVTYFRPDRVWTDHVDWKRRYMGTLKREKLAECRAAVSRFILAQ